MSAGAAQVERLPPRSDGVDPRLAKLIEAMARDAAQTDHRAVLAAQMTKESKPCRGAR